MEKIHTYRIMPDERQYLEKYYNNSFSTFVHDSFKHNIDLTKNNKKKNRLQKYSQATVLLAFGMIFMFMTLQQSTILGAIIVFIVGVFFISTGGATLYYDFKERKK